MDDLYYPEPSTTVKILNIILLSDVPHADVYLLLAAIFLSLLALAQKLNVFTRPPPVPLKVLPRRPALQVLFKPDDAVSSSSGGSPAVGASAASLVGNIIDDTVSLFSDDEVSSWGDSLRPPSGVTGANAGGSSWRRDGTSSTAFSARSAQSKHTQQTATTHHQAQKSTSSRKQQSSHFHKNTNTILHGLPDSFAPLLSSSEMEVLTTQLTADLIHAVQVQAQVRLREGRHTLPLDKNELRPQFWFEGSSNGNITSGGSDGEKGCRISANVTIGSERLSLDQDLDTTQPTSQRSRPMVKSADIILDPPLRLGNVAPTLLHFPDLFEDRLLPRLRRMQFMRLLLDFISSCWFLLEKVLWIIERRCQVHLSKVKATPVYRGLGEDDTSQWRLSLSFTGHLLLFDWIPFPFISFQLPTFIIPQPHALLEYLLTSQPLASATLRRENIAEERIVIAALNALETWSTNVKAVVTPPALEVDLTLPGGITVAVEMMHGREVTQSPRTSGIPRVISSDTLPSWFTPHHSNTNIDSARSRHSGRGSPPPMQFIDSVRSGRPTGANAAQIPAKLFDANSLVPWYFEASVDGFIGKDKIVLNVPVCRGRHYDDESPILSKSGFTLTGSMVVCRAQSAVATNADRRPTPARPPLVKRQLSSNSHLVALTSLGDAPPIHALLMYPGSYMPTSKRSSNHLVEYDYEFDVGEDTHLDAVSLSYGASHPMLKGGTIISCMLESIYAYGSIFAREGAIADPSEKLRKRNILRHLPAVEFTAGIENTYLPKQSVSYFDDGNTRSIPEMDGGRVMFRVIGGLDDKMFGDRSPGAETMVVREGIKLIADFGVSSFSSTSETNVAEFPELDIFQGSKLCSFILGTFDGCVTCHLRPQSISKSVSSSGPNVFNPLEAYEIDFGGSSVSLRLKESSFNLVSWYALVAFRSDVYVRSLLSVILVSH